MSTSWNPAALLEPIAGDDPCGRNLDETDRIAAFDAYQIFGQTTLDPVPGDLGDAARREPRKSDRPPNWAELRDLSVDTLATSKDLRVLAHLGAASLRLDGLAAFSQVVSLASNWLTNYWPQVYPRLEDGDAIFRQSALNCFADRVAVIEGLRRAPLAASRQHGRFSLRDLEIAAGTVQPADGDIKADEAQIAAAFADMPFADLQALQESVAQALATLHVIDDAMRQEASIEAAPSFEPLTAQLQKIDAALRARVATHPGAPADVAAASDGAAQTDGGVIAVGAIRSRQDAIRALEAAAEFFRRNEPSSPVPLLVERAKRLVAKDFLEVLEDLAPDALHQARSAAGLRD